MCVWVCVINNNRIIDQLVRLTFFLLVLVGGLLAYHKKRFPIPRSSSMDKVKDCDRVRGGKYRNYYIVRTKSVEADAACSVQYEGIS